MTNNRLRWRLTVAGLATTCSITALAALAHLLVYRVAFPAQAIAQNAVGVTSGRVQSFFVQLLGHWAERLLVIGLSVGFAVSGAVLVHLVPRKRLDRRWTWVLVPLVLWVITVAVYSVPQPFLGRWAFASATLPIFLLGGLFGGSTFSRIGAPERPEQRRTARSRVESPLDPHVTRRALLAAFGLGGLGVAIGSSPLVSLIGGPSDTGSVRLRTAGVVRATRPPPV